METCNGKNSRDIDNNKLILDTNVKETTTDQTNKTKAT